MGTTVADGREKVEPEKPELMLPVLKPVPEKPIVPDVQQVGTAINQAPVQWQVRPLDSRPNLQALLEREQTNEHSSRQTTPPPSTASTPMDTLHLSKCVSAQVSKRSSVVNDSHDLRIMYEAQVTSMSVRNKVQRFEASHVTTSTHSSGVSTPPFKQKKQQQPQRILKENAVPAFLLREPEVTTNAPEASKVAKTPSFPVQQKTVRNSQSFSSFPDVQIRPKTSAKLLNG